MRYLFFISFICSGAFGQSVNNEYRNKQIVFVFKGGMDLVNNYDLNNWLSQYGVTTTSKCAYNFGIKALLPGPGKLLIGGEFNWVVSSHPDKNDLSFDLELGKCFKTKYTHVIPLIGVGIVNSLIRFGDHTPSPLVQINASGGQLSENSFLIKPNILIIKNFYPYTLGIELGCKLYSLPSTWKYYENGANGSYVKVPQVPYNGLFHPYASLVIGFNVGF